MRRSLAILTVLVCTLAVGTACGDDDTTSDDSDIQTIDITFSGDRVTPSGERVEVRAGQPVDVVVKADEPGEIHVHSDPEQQFEYASGTTTLKMTIDRPGPVEVESHDLEQVIVQLQVR